MRKYLLVLASFIITILAFSSITYESLDSTVVAIVNGKVIPSTLLNARTKMVKLLSDLMRINSTFYNVVTKTATGLQTLKLYTKTVLDKIIGQELFIQYVESKGINLKRKEMFDEYAKQINEAFDKSNLSSENEKMYLYSKGYQNREEYIMDFYYDSLYKAAIEELYKKIFNEVEVTKEELMDYYQKNKDKYYTPKSAIIKLVFFDTSEEASAVYKKIIDGYYDFDQVYSASDSATEITISLEQDGTLSDKIKNLPAGSIIEPQQIAGKYILIKIQKKIPKKMLTFEEAKDMVEADLRDEKAKVVFENKIKAEFEEFKKNSKIIINSDLFY